MPLSTWKIQGVTVSHLHVTLNIYLLIIDMRRVIYVVRIATESSRFGKHRMRIRTGSRASTPRTLPPLGCVVGCWKAELFSLLSRK
ncbi:hypothetical protein CDAR_317961 [Caerostris darwini]|uniref:Uncharacterized protein n=1 Tax=Caerostris darwini TaxID=1538125 RepID=A0AAV4WR67_9ARAC|nr:hypothetical protein CDAR_317961 [Caerostris darwini]